MRWDEDNQINHSNLHLTDHSFSFVSFVYRLPALMFPAFCLCGSIFHVMLWEFPSKVWINTSHCGPDHARGIFIGTNGPWSSDGDGNSIKMHLLIVKSNWQQLSLAKLNLQSIGKICLFMTQHFHLSARSKCWFIVFKIYCWCRYLAEKLMAKSHIIWWIIDHS